MYIFQENTILWIGPNALHRGIICVWLLFCKCNVLIPCAGYYRVKLDICSIFNGYTNYYLQLMAPSNLQNVQWSAVELYLYDIINFRMISTLFDTIKGNESLVEIFNFYFLAPLSQNLQHPWHPTHSSWSCHILIIVTNKCYLQQTHIKMFIKCCLIAVIFNGLPGHGIVLLIAIFCFHNYTLKLIPSFKHNFLQFQIIT